MKAKQELIDQFRKEFDDERRNRLRKPWRYAEMIVSSFLVVAIFTIWNIIERGVKVDVGTGIMGIIMFFFGICAFVGIHLRCFNITKLKSSKEETLKELIKSKDENELSLKNIAITDQRPYGLIIHSASLPYWIRLGRKYGLESEYPILSRFEKDISSQHRRIANCEAWIVVYDQTPEKTFWQYLRSKKWKKKIKSTQL